MHGQQNTKKKMHSQLPDSTIRLIDFFITYIIISQSWRWVYRQTPV